MHSRSQYSKRQIGIAIGKNVHTSAGGVQWSHVEDINALHLSEDFESLETGGLVQIGGDGTSGGSGGKKVLFGLDICKIDTLNISSLVLALQD